MIKDPTEAQNDKAYREYMYDDCIDSISGECTENPFGWWHSYNYENGRCIYCGEESPDGMEEE